MTDNNKIEKKIDVMMDHQSRDTDEIIKLVNKIEGTHGDRYLLSVLVAEVNTLRSNVQRLSDRVQDLENINESLSDSLRRKNEYQY